MRFINLIIFLFVSLMAFGQLEQTALNKINELNALIISAENNGIDATKEKMTIRTAEVFLGYANWDEANVTENTSFFQLVNIYASNASQLANDLPDLQRSEIIIMLDEAITKINQLINGDIVRKPTPIVDWANVSISGNQVLQNGSPVFLSDYTWKPSIDDLTEYFGNKDGVFLSVAHVINSTGGINQSKLNEISSKPNGRFGSVFLNQKGIKDWAETLYGPDFIMREDTFTAFDIDNPGARQLQSYLLDATVPQMAGKKYTELGYMLTNEPHFYTTDGVWATGPVSSYTIDKFKVWLSTKHTSITDLNAHWGTNFSNFNDVTIAMPISGSLKGTPIWYDWNKFNMYRVNDWFTFLKNKIQENDPNAKTHIKIIPRFWSDDGRDSGIDLEALTRLTEIIGNDAKSYNSYMWGNTEDWESRYNLYWRGLSMSYDFMRSVSPNKIIYNSEAHFLSTVKFRDLYLEPSYAREAYWLAHLHGMNVSQTWFWSRREDGSIRNNSGKGYAGSNNQQPRIVNEVASTVMDLNAHAEDIAALQVLRKPIRIFYSQASAINKTDYMDNTFDLYESMYFEGISIGFATKGILDEQNSLDWDVIAAYDTEFITLDELTTLQSYLDNGGTLIKDAISFTKNEYGQTHTTTLTGNIISRNTFQTISDEALSIVSANGGLPNITLSETNTLNQKGCHWKSYTNNQGEHIITIVNLGKENAQVSLGLMDVTIPLTVTNLLTQEVLPSNLEMEPEDVLLLRVQDASLSVDDYELTNRINCYPNPTKGIVHFDSADAIKKVKIYNLLGQNVTTQIGNSNKITLDVNSLKSGIYIAEVICENYSKSIKLIKK